MASSKYLEEYGKDSLRLSTLNAPSERFELLSELAYKYCRDAKSMPFTEEALLLAEDHGYEITWQLKISQVWYELFRKNWAAADSCLIDLTSEIQKDDTSTKNIERIYHAANQYYYLLKYLDASKYFEQLLQISLENDKRRYAILAYDGLRSVARSNKDFNLEQVYLDEFLNYLNDTSLEKGLAYQQYAENCISRKDNNCALENLKSAMKIFQEKKDTLRIASVKNTMGWVYNEIAKIDSAIMYYHESIKVSEEYGYIIMSADSYGNLGDIYFKLKQFDTALSYFHKILEKAIQKNYVRYIRFGYARLADTYDSLGMYHEAYLNFKHYSNLMDSIRSDEIDQIYIEERTKFETERKEKELEILDLKLRKNRLILYFSIGGAVLVIFIALLLYRQSRLKSKQRLAEYKKQLAEIKQLSLRKQMNPHFVFNTLNSIQFFMFQNDKMATNNYMSKFAMLVRKTLENSQHNAVPIKYELEALQLYVELEQLRFKNSFSFKLNIDDEIDTLQHKIPTMLIQPFVENSINHGLHYVKENGILIVNLKLIDNHLIECVVEDNGIGRGKAEEIKKTKHKNHHSLGTTITEERLKVIDTVAGNQLKVEYIDLKDESDKAIGTRVIIRIPILT